MAKGVIGGKIVLEGESQYRAALKNIKTEQTELRSEMRLCQSTFKENQNSIEALQKKHEILTKQIDTQTQKVEVYQKAMLDSIKKEDEAAQKIEDLKTALDKAQKEMQEMESCTGATTEELEEQAKTIVDLKSKLALAEENYDKATQTTSKYRTSVNYAQSELQNMQTELGKTEKYLKEASDSTDHCATSIDEYGKEIKEASDETTVFGDMLKANIASDVIIGGLSKLAELSKEAGKALIDCAIGAAAYADEIMTTSANTGIAAETLQELTYAQELMDVSLEDVTNSMAKNIKSMSSARDGSKSYAEAYEKLGISVTGANGQLRDSETVFWEVVDALGSISNETERDAIAMQLFGRKAQDLNSLIAIGSEGFNEFAEEARKTGYVLSEDSLKGLLKTSDAMERMKNRLTSVKNNIGSELAPVLEKSFKRIGDVVEDAEEGIIDFAEDAIPALITGLEWIVENADIVAAGIGGITTATIYHSTVAPAIVTITTAWEAYKKANEGATVSQWLLNTAMNANPAGVLVTAVVGLTAAVSAYAIINKDNNTVIDETTKVTRELVSASEELNNSYLTAKEARKSSRESLDAEAKSCNKLVAELKELQQKTTLTSTEQARQRMIVDELNSAMPKLNLQIDEQTGKINKSTEALEDNIEVMMEAAKVEAAREDLIVIAKEQYEAEKQLVELEEQLVEQKKAVTEAQNEFNESLENFSRTQTAFGETYTILEDMSVAELAVFTKSKEAVDEAKEAQKELEEQIKNTSTTISDLTAEYGKVTDYISNTEPIDTATNATSELGNSASTARSQILQMSEDAQEAYQTMRDSLTQTVQSQMDLFSEFSTGTKTSTEEILNNMQSQVDGITSWADNMALLADKGINQGLLQYLADLGPEGAGYVAAFVKMTDEELQKANDLFDQSLSIPSDVVDKISTAYLEAGTKAGKQFKTGIDEAKEPVSASAKELAQAALDVTEDTLDINSPSGETKKIGENFDTGLQEGIESGKDDVLTTVTNVSAEIVDVTKECLKTSIFEETGKQITEGIKIGIESGKSSIVETLKEMCTNVIDTMNTELDIHSPSRKSFWSGEMYGEGFIEGYKNRMININSVISEALPDETMIRTSSSKQLGENIASENENQLLNALEATNEKYTEAIMELANNISVPVILRLEGEAAGVFKLVESENNKYIKATGYNRLADK